MCPRGYLLLLLLLGVSPGWGEGQKPPEKKPVKTVESHPVRDLKEGTDKALNDIDRGIHKAIPAVKEGAEKALDAVDQGVHKVLAPKKK